MLAPPVRSKFNFDHDKYYDDFYDRCCYEAMF